MNFRHPFPITIVSILSLMLMIQIKAHRNSPSIPDWKIFKEFHNKSYHNSTHEAYHKQIFNRNKLLVDTHNQYYRQGLVLYTIESHPFLTYRTKNYSIASSIIIYYNLDPILDDQELNRFADEDEATLKTRRGYKASAPNPNWKQTKLQLKSLANLPNSFDWRNSNAVSPVKDQGQCGCCWAFSATGALESLAYLKTKNMNLFSEQQLVDCDRVDAGCNGGNQLNAWNYIHNIGGIEAESSYPYTSGKTMSAGRCAANNGKYIQKVLSYTVLAQNEDTIRQTLVSIGPLSIAMDASKLSPYSGGIFSCPSKYTLDHAVLLVGYGTDTTGNKYWIVKNQWGTKWGLNGYFYLQRGANACGMNVQAAYPNI